MISRLGNVVDSNTVQQLYFTITNAFLVLHDDLIEVKLFLEDDTIHKINYGIAGNIDSNYSEL